MPSERRDHDRGGSRGLPAGPLAKPATAYRVRYRGLLRTGWHRIRAVLPLTLAPVSAGLVLLFLVLPAHRAVRGDGQALLGLADSVTVASLGLVAVFAPVGLALAVHAVTVARDPVPVTPEPGTRVAFLTTYVPGREPLSAVRANLEGAARMRHPGPLDVWLLDEGDDPEARMLCAELGVHHFTRLGVPEWNQEEGPHQAGTEHGNRNAWIAKHGDAYDLLASVDTDHVPLPGFLERTTGYFRDPDTAFVVGPWLAGDHDFHALVQRAGNRYGAPVLAGPGSVVRIAALRQAGGFHGSGTEDTATGFEIHRRRNPGTGQYWRSVHTPDVPASREGHVSPADRHGRWPHRSRVELLRQYRRALFRVPPGRLIGYTLLLVHHPVATVGGLLGVLSCLAATVHTAARGWALLALLIALAPLAARSFTLLRERGYGGGARLRSRVPGPGQETEPALATAAGSPAAGG
ncbi:glycosyl transferase [Streptomyces sp. NPDC048430]|uniref:glycosyl transferase n=1 Tax=unclassified Streptomyces TaxID=2593676 RepID=UPI003422821F